MSKKDFKKGFSGLLGEEETTVKKPLEAVKEIKKRETPKASEKRATFIVSTQFVVYDSLINEIVSAKI